MKLKTFFEKFDQFADAPGAVAKMREFVLAMAVQGRLSDQRSSDSSVEALVQRLRESKITHSRARDLKVEEVASAMLPYQVPLHWTCIRLNDIGAISGGHTPSKNNHRFWNGDIPWFTSKDIKSDEIYESELKITEAAANSPGLQFYPPGCLFMVARSGILKRTFPIAINRVAATANQDLKILRPFVPGLERYLQIMLRGLTPFILSQLVKTGMTVQSLKYDEFAAQHFPLPPLAEQKRIVAKVDELMALCDRLEAQQQAREEQSSQLARASLARFATAPTPANLNFLFHPTYNISPSDLRKSILTLAVQGKLATPDATEESIDRLLATMDERRNELIAAKKIRKPRDLPPVGPDEPPFSVPTGWRWKRWGHICDWITYGFTRPMAHVPKGPPIVTAKNVQDGFLTFENANRAEATEFANLNAKDLPRKGDILITKDGTIGRAAIVDTDEPFCINQSVAVLWLESCLLYRPYLLIVIRSPFAQLPIWEAAEGMAIKHLSITDFGKMLLPVPPLAEQRRIVAKVSQLMTLVDELETHLTTTRTTAQNLLSALVAELTLK